jgi:Tfp pilus assembly protein PilP
MRWLALRAFLALLPLLALGVLATPPSALAGHSQEPAGGAAGEAAAVRNNGAGGTAPGGAAAVDAPIAKRLTALRKKVLKDEDFVENDEINRDPFHSYMRLFVDHGAAKSHKVAAIFDKVGLDELSLIAIVSGDETPRAMFRDATGFGQAVKKGEFLSRAAARVTKILSDRVIVELSETTGSGETRVIEKAILVNPGEAP